MTIPSASELGKVFDRVPLVQFSERRRYREWACLNATDGVALRAVRLQQDSTPLRTPVLSQCRPANQE